MNKLLQWGFLLVCGLMAMACSDDEGTVLEVPTDQIELDASGTEYRLEVSTNSRLWSATSTADWIMTERDSIYLVIKATSNPTKQPRSGKLYLVADDQYVRLWISQEGSIRELGDPYPNAENPIGIIWKMTDGGKHGKILALDDTLFRWAGRGISITHSPGARSNTDGLANTKYMIETYQNEERFDTLYPVFHYIHNVKNKGDINGGWYIPAYNELTELYYTLCGKVYTTQPSATAGIRHDLEVRERFNYWMQQAGGTPVLYDDGYWSSSEYSNTNSKATLFKNGSSWGNSYFSGKNSLYYVRAVKEF
jgi:hypothetical protein